MHVHKENRKDPFSRNVNVAWGESSYKIPQQGPICCWTLKSFLHCEYQLQMHWEASWVCHLFLIQTDSQHNHTEIHTGTLRSAGLWLSCSQELSPEAAAHSLSRGLGSKELSLRPWGCRYQTVPFCIPNGKGVAVIKKRSLLIVYLEYSANSLVSFYSPHERIM